MKLDRRSFMTSGIAAAAVMASSRAAAFKPDPRASRLGLDLLGVAKHELMFVAFAGWDAAGARWFGYPTFWNNRQGAAQEMLGVQADGGGATLGDLTRFVGVR